MRKWTLLAVTAGAAFVSVCPSASAGTSGYSASSCAGAGFPIPTVYYEGTSAKVLSPAINLACPAVQSGGPLMGGSVAGRDWHGTKSVSCSGRARNATDTGGVVTPSAISGGAFIGPFNVAFGPAMAPGYYADGSKVVVCTLPELSGGEGSSLATYQVIEETL